MGFDSAAERSFCRLPRRKDVTTSISLSYVQERIARVHALEFDGVVAFEAGDSATLQDEEESCSVFDNDLDLQSNLTADSPHFWPTSHL